MNAPPPPLFSQQRRRAQLARAVMRGTGQDFIAPLITESLLDRLDMVTRRFDDALVIASSAHPLATAIADRAVRVTRRDMIDWAPTADDPRYDLILWPAGLELIDDVPGALIRARQQLRPDGLLIGALVGDGSFALLRRLLTSEGIRAIPRMHPQIDLKTMGNLLQRSGFALPVCDVEANVVRYREWRAIVADLRAAGLAGQLAAPPPPLTRAELGVLDKAFAAATGGDGRAEEVLRIIYFTAWAPHPSQPQPARRGSGKGSLAQALKAVNPPDV